MLGKPEPSASAVDSRKTASCQIAKQNNDKNYPFVVTKLAVAALAFVIPESAAEVRLAFFPFMH
jgi:hypothetical protein